MNKFLELLKTKFSTFMQETGNKRASFKKWVQANGGFLNTKIFIGGISIVISIILWLFVAWDGSTEGVRTLEVPLQYTNLSRGYTIYESTKTVEVRMLGRMNILSRVTPSELKAEVDLQGLQSGTFKLPIRIEGPQFVRIRNWHPSTAEIEIYRQVERTLPIFWSAEGKLPEGKIISFAEISPTDVTVTGPEVDVLSVQNVQVLIPVEKLTENTVLKLPVKISDKSQESDRLQLSPATVNVKVTLEDEIVGEQIPVRIPVVGSPADGLEVEKITVLPEKVTIRGAGEAVRNMTSLVLPPIDVSGLDQNLQLMLPLQPEEDPGVEILGPGRARVEITLRKKMAAKTYTSVPILVSGAASGTEWRVSPAAANLTIEGSQIAIDALFTGPIPCELYVDVTNIVNKQLSLPVLVRNLKREFEIVQIDPPQVTITVVE